MYDDSFYPSPYSALPAAHRWLLPLTQSDSNTIAEEGAQIDQDWAALHSAIAAEIANQSNINLGNIRETALRLSVAQGDAERLRSILPGTHLVRVGKMALLALREALWQIGCQDRE